MMKKMLAFFGAPILAFASFFLPIQQITNHKDNQLTTSNIQIRPEDQIHLISAHWAGLHEGGGTNFFPTIMLDFDKTYTNDVATDIFSQFESLIFYNAQDEFVKGSQAVLSIKIDQKSFWSFERITDAKKRIDHYHVKFSLQNDVYKIDWNKDYYINLTNKNDSDRADPNPIWIFLNHNYIGPTVSSASINNDGTTISLYGNEYNPCPSNLENNLAITLNNVQVTGFTCTYYSQGADINLSYKVNKNDYLVIQYKQETSIIIDTSDVFKPDVTHGVTKYTVSWYNSYLYLKSSNFKIIDEIMQSQSPDIIDLILNELVESGIPFGPAVEVLADVLSGFGTSWTILHPASFDHGNGVIIKFISFVGVPLLMLGVETQ